MDRLPISWSETVTAGAMSAHVKIRRGGASVTVSPVSGGTMRVYKSVSPESAVLADLDDSSLNYTNLLAGTQPTTSRWMLWASGAVTDVTNEGPLESDGDTFLIATSTTQAGLLEVSQ